MQNIASIYRFNTPFLDIAQEKSNLVSALEKIKNTISLDGIYFQETRESNQEYHEVSLLLNDNLGEFRFYYISNLDAFDEGRDYLPIFRLEIYLHDRFISTPKYRKRLTEFMESVFECFDGLNEKEFLIDLHAECYYKAGFLKRKKYPHYDFSDISTIQKSFESKDGMKKLENFITEFSGQSFILTNKTAKYYHEIHGIMLYFIYLVYIIAGNLKKTKKVQILLGDENVDNGHVRLTAQRLKHMDEINNATFIKYMSRLELFFKLFK